MAPCPVGPLAEPRAGPDPAAAEAVGADRVESAGGEAGAAAAGLDPAAPAPAPTDATGVPATCGLPAATSGGAARAATARRLRARARARRSASRRTAAAALASASTRRPSKSADPPSAGPNLVTESASSSRPPEAEGDACRSEPPPWAANPTNAAASSAAAIANTAPKRSGRRSRRAPSGWPGSSSAEALAWLAPGELSAPASPTTAGGSSGTWRTLCSESDRSVQKSAALGERSGSGDEDGPGGGSAEIVDSDSRRLSGECARGPKGTSRSRGPSQSRGSRTTFASARSCALSASRSRKSASHSSVPAAEDPSLKLQEEGVLLARYYTD